MLRTYLPLIMLLLLTTAACGGSTVESPAAMTPLTADAAVTNTAPPQTATAVPDTPRITATALTPAAPTAVPTTIPTETQPDPTATTAAPVVTSGRLPEGAFFLGDPAAPVTMIDYSDFL